mmetsp:Transcript_19573/g.27539  ORF Transcript_19573/g.27539 Transcript_19573/m.27539 type:complete len:125 (-) Transcript_19573:70-444(-)
MKICSKLSKRAKREQRKWTKKRKKLKRKLNEWNSITFSLVPFPGIDPSRELKKIEKTSIKTENTTTILQLAKYLAKKIDLSPGAIEIVYNNMILGTQRELGGYEFFKERGKKVVLHYRRKIVQV